jgi:hypothetical protein
MTRAALRLGLLFVLISQFCVIKFALCRAAMVVLRRSRIKVVISHILSRLFNSFGSIRRDKVCVKNVFYTLGLRESEEYLIKS